MVKKILILAANPKDTQKLRLDEEVREIQAGLERAQKRDRFEIVSRWAVRSNDLRRALLDIEPQIVHFSGHGAGEDGLVLEDEQGQAKLVSADALARLFRLFENQVECVLLNACYSALQAEAIHQSVNIVIGMEQAIADRAAVKFAVGFYDALGAGRSYQDAFEFGCSAIDLEGIPEYLMPVLKQRVKAESPVSILKAVEELEPTSKPVVLETPEGQVPLDSPFYVERPPIESDCYQAIAKTGALIRIKAPRQMGKSSLMKRILHHAAQQGCQVVELSLQEAEGEIFTDLDRFLQWFCNCLADELKLPNKLVDYWQSVLGSKRKCSKYFQKYLLSEIASPLALGLDEVDRVFKYPDIATDFLGLLRTWHEWAKNQDIWKKLRLVIVHSKEVYIPLNINQSPFNVGVSIELPELNRPQVQDLVQRHGLQWTDEGINQLMGMVGGHPYLVRVALYEIARGRRTLAELLRLAPTEEGPYNDHLRRHWLNLEENVNLVNAIKQVMAVERPSQIGAKEAFKLHSMGLVKFQGNTVVPLCEMYRQYFRNRLKVKI